MSGKILIMSSVLGILGIISLAGFNFISPANSKLVDSNEKEVTRSVEEELLFQYNQPEILESQNISALSSSSLLDIEIKIDDQDVEYESFELAIHYRDEKNNIDLPLLTTYGSLKDTYADIHYTLYSTKNSDYPYLLFYSGQAGDEYNTVGALILFSSTKKIGELFLNDGNRINAELIEIVPNKITVKEAIMCHQSIQTTIAFNEQGLERMEGFFPVNTLYPNNDYVPDPSHKSGYTIQNELIVSLEVNNRTKTYKEGETITITPQWVDFDMQIIFLKVNEDKVSMELDKYKMIPMVQSMYGAKCEMG